jgi:hypothetical protein
MSVKGLEAQDAERRDWAVSGGDWAYFLVQFLRGQRRLPIQQSEIVETQLYQRANDLERKALLLVCDGNQAKYIEPEQKRQLVDRDSWLMLFTDGKNLGHADRVAQVMQIPAAVAAREKWDRDMFLKAHYPVTRLFDFIWDKAR